MKNKHKIINDPVHGLVPIPNQLVFEIIEHPYFQRLRRIQQTGLTSLVYPGAVHTRFHHALGCLFLMQRAVEVLKYKKIEISEEEETALYIAILLHDLGHGPFSHTLENEILGVSHELISLQLMKEINRDFDGKLELAIQLFQNKYHRPFFHQLISSQIDIDRLDYLERDSFFTGVKEGSIHAERLVKLMTVQDDNLLFEEKAAYSIEKFFVSRMLMYWQVYYHKTSFAAELMLKDLFKYVKDQKVESSIPSVNYFIQKDTDSFDQLDIETFAQLEDMDIWSALKQWKNEGDARLSEMSYNLLSRKLYTLRFYSDKSDILSAELDKISRYSDFGAKLDKVQVEFYNKNNSVKLLSKSNQVVDFQRYSIFIRENANMVHQKYYSYFPKIKD